jgi:hypothetical protein
MSAQTLKQAPSAKLGPFAGLSASTGAEPECAESSLLDGVHGGPGPERCEGGAPSAQWTYEGTKGPERRKKRRKRQIGGRCLRLGYRGWVTAWRWSSRSPGG